METAPIECHLATETASTTSLATIDVDWFGFHAKRTARRSERDGEGEKKNQRSNIPWKEMIMTLKVETFRQFITSTDNHVDMAELNSTARV